ncbi:hypothetical protein DPX16_14820 [Anabarilius grahami]|uniref:Uncharacterized protein n=1 Tax=Anabarilius grahami TaxID=495550 RepID=A0A3N0YBH1_ANAGA|nr:hypothetical protein DPX16_14820 [Anabarilius grahami]
MGRHSSDSEDNSRNRRKRRQRQRSSSSSSSGSRVTSRSKHSRRRTRSRDRNRVTDRRIAAQLKGTEIVPTVALPEGPVTGGGAEAQIGCGTIGPTDLDPAAEIGGVQIQDYRCAAALLMADKQSKLPIPRVAPAHKIKTGKRKKTDDDDKKATCYVS